MYKYKDAVGVGTMKQMYIKSKSGLDLLDDTCDWNHIGHISSDFHQPCFYAFNDRHQSK